ncbi:MAG: beta-ketoacyl synthase N-terminal-like domain-containing protein [Chthoniobacterales bacterium]
MSVHIGGMGWVTPLGCGISEVWERLLAGDEAAPATVESALDAPSYPAFRVPAEALAKAPAHPRLRRSSAISRFAVVAGLAALEDAGVTLDPASAERTAIIFAISNGGVVYTKRFYHEVVESGAQAASPLLFPETVFNAPASHLAAILGITGASYTLVGDGTVGVLALKMAEDLMQNPALDRCLVVGAEEADWLLCDAFRRWRLSRPALPIEVFRARPRGMILSEGAGAVLVDRAGSTVIEQIDSGSNFSRQSDAATCVDTVFQHLGATANNVIVASANGTFIDTAEKTAVLHHCPAAAVYAPKAALGESVGAGSLWQVICATQILRTQQLPPIPHLAPENEIQVSGSARKNLGADRVLVSSCGMNQQVAGLSLRRGDSQRLSGV